MAEQTNTPEDWQFLAERDLSVADHLAANMRPVPTEIIAFHCQQAVEKYLKGTLEFFGEDPPYIHDLDDLCKLAEKHRTNFVSINSLCNNNTIFGAASLRPRH